MLYLFLLCLLSRCRVHSEMTSIGVWISSLRHKEALFSLFTCYVTWPCMQPYTKEGSLKNGGLVASPALCAHCYRFVRVGRLRNMTLFDSYTYRACLPQFVAHPVITKLILHQHQSFSSCQRTTACFC